MSNLVTTQQTPQALPAVADSGAVIIDDTRSSLPSAREIREKLVVPRHYGELPQGVTIAAEDQPIFDSFGQAIWNAGASPEVFAAAARWYYTEFGPRLKAVESANRAENTQRLYELWGDEYGANVNTCHRLIDSAGEEIGNLVFNARLADGSLLGDSPEVLTWLLGIARMKQQQTVQHSGGTHQSRDAELETLERMMSDKNSRYWKGREAEQLQERYRELVAANEEGRTLPR